MDVGSSANGTRVSLRSEGRSLASRGPVNRLRPEKRQPLDSPYERVSALYERYRSVRSKRRSSGRRGSERSGQGSVPRTDPGSVSSSAGTGRKRPSVGLVKRETRPRYGFAPVRGVSAIVERSRTTPGPIRIGGAHATFGKLPLTPRFREDRTARSGKRLVGRGRPRRPVDYYGVEPDRRPAVTPSSGPSNEVMSPLV